MLLRLNTATVENVKGHLSLACYRRMSQAAGCKGAKEVRKGESKLRVACKRYFSTEIVMTRSLLSMLINNNGIDEAERRTNLTLLGLSQHFSAVLLQS